jgi:hypothetical protein
MLWKILKYDHYMTCDVNGNCMGKCSNVIKETTETDAIYTTNRFCGLIII